MGADAQARSVHEEGVTEACVLKFINHSARHVKCLWVDFDGDEKEYNELAPGVAQPQSAWRCSVIALQFVTNCPLLPCHVHVCERA